jgi:Relaxase/Mobilisation nuclease domain
MIVHVTDAGKGIAGIVNYVYDRKLAERQTADKQAEVLLHSDNLRMPRDAEDLAGRRNLVKDFKDQEIKSSKNIYNVGKHIISFSNDDMKKLNKAEITSICEEYITMAGLENTQYFAVTHNDTDNFHVHLIFNRTQSNGKKYNDSFEKIKTTNRAAAISLNRNLPLKEKLWTFGQTHQVADLRKNHPKILELMNDPDATLLQIAKGHNHLVKLGENQGLKIQNYVDQQAYLKENNLKLGDLPKNEHIKHNHTKIGETQYRNEDLGAIYAKNREAALNQRLEKSEEKLQTQKQAKLAKQILKQSILTEYQPKLENISNSQQKLVDFGNEIEHEKKAHVKKLKVKSWEIKVEKIGRGRGIKR